MSVSTSSLPIQRNVDAAVGVNDAGRDQYVRVRAAELEFALNTECLSGVFQVSNQHRLTGNGTVLTPKGEYPLSDLSEVLQKNLGVEAGGSQAQALISLESQGQMRMLLADSVSRPIKVKDEHVHPMPSFCFQRRRPSDLIRSVVNFDATEIDPTENLRFVLDVDVIFGVKASPALPANVLPQQAVQAMTAGENLAHQSSQLLAFIPEDVEASQVEHIFCLPLSAVAEVITIPPTLNRLGANETFEGFTLWRSVPVPIIRLGKVFGIGSSTETDPGHRLIIARATNNRFVGICAKPQMHTMRVPASTPGNARPFAGRPFLGCFNTDLGELVVPDVDRILKNDF